MPNPAQRRCFVLMPFADKFREVYDNVYKIVCAANSIQCWRVDEISRPGSITRDIIEGIISADIVIADLTSRNANVFYELGIAHSIGNTTIMTAQSHDDVPFDIASYRVIFCEQSITGANRLKRDLDKAVKELLTSLQRTNNPVQEMLASKSSLGIKRKTPLYEVINIGQIPSRAREFIQQENIVFIEDLISCDLEAIRKKYGLGATSLAPLVYALIKNHDPDVIKKAQHFAMNHRVNFDGYSFMRWQLH